MPQIYSHYDNLKVARNAPPEVIRAAYRTLSQKFHPDRNPGNSEAARIMAIINTSYEVLSDPDKRHEHDLWIAQQERLLAQTAQPQPQPQPKAVSGVIFAHILRNWLAYGVLAFFVWILATVRPSTPPPGPKPYQANPTPSAQPRYVRSNTAPNGQPWPASAGYVNDYQQLHNDGLSSITVDNSQNDSDVFVKLVSLDGANAYPVRQFFIPGFGSFTLNKVTAGSYDIRYRDLVNGGLSRSEQFSVEEIPTYNGTKFSKLTMTLYKVQHGNMQTYGLSETEF